METRHKVTPIVILMILSMNILLTINIQRAEAVWTTGTIYIKADGRVEPWDTPIKKVSNTYLLTDDIEITTGGNGIVIEKDGIVFDGGGHIISWRESSDIFAKPEGIYLKGIRNITIKNTVIKNFYTGIEVRNSLNIIIYGNKIENNKASSVGIYLYESSNSNIYENQIKKNEIGIVIEYSPNSVIYRNIIENNDFIGIVIKDSSNSIIHENKIKNNLYGIRTGELLFEDHSLNNTISRNIIENNVYGIYLYGSTSYNIYGNTFTNCGLYFDFYGYYWRRCHNSVKDNTVNGKPLTYLEDVSNYIVNDAGQVILIRCNGITIKDLLIFNVRGSIQLFSTNNCVITGNNIENGDIVLFLSSCNRIFENRIVGVPPFNIDKSSNNKFFHNDFVVGTRYEEVYLSPDNIWDDGYPSGGNYWSNYRGVDKKSGPNQDQQGSDGIGDKPYSRDRYPFMKPRLIKFLKKTSLKVEINPPEITEKSPFQPIAVTISCRLTNEGGEGLRERIINIYIDNYIIKSGVTDSNGCYSYEWKDVDLERGIYKITVKFDGDYTYSASNASTTLTVRPAPLIIEILQPWIPLVWIIIAIVLVLYLKGNLLSIITSRKSFPPPSPPLLSPQPPSKTSATQSAILKLPGAPREWPSRSEYNIAIQNPHICFIDPELKKARVIKRGSWSYCWSSGRFAIVFKVEIGNTPYIIRCFHSSPIVNLKERYEKITEYLSTVSIPNFVKFEFIDKGIQITKNGKYNCYPIIKMECVDGKNLDTWTEEKVETDDRRAIRKIADDFLNCMKLLKKYKIAHGDLSHDNIIVDKNGNIKLVDYDGIFIPTFKHEKAPELGHLCYQHPKRDASFYNEKIDNFSILVIYLSLLAIADDPSLWKKYNNGENLIFTAEDFKDPANSILLQSLKRNRDTQISKLATLLEESCKKDPELVPDIRDFIS
jgi:parallel beta-helix repeat protein